MNPKTDTAPKMTPPSDRHARRREATRRKLIEATKTLIGRDGVDNIRIQEITDEADVGFGSFYNHFPGKEAIVEAVLAETIGAQKTHHPNTQPQSAAALRPSSQPHPSV